MWLKQDASHQCLAANGAYLSTTVKQLAFVGGEEEIKDAELPWSGELKAHFGSMCLLLAHRGLGAAACILAARNDTYVMECPAGYHFCSIDMASYGMPRGHCAEAGRSAARHLPCWLATRRVVEEHCIGKQQCTLSGACSLSLYAQEDVTMSPSGLSWREDAAVTR